MSIDLPPPRIITRRAILRGIRKGQHDVVEGSRQTLSDACTKVFGKGNYRVQAIDDKTCHVWHLSERQKKGGA